MKLEQLSEEIWDHNYRLGNENSVTDLWIRLAKSCAEIEDDKIKHKVKDKFYNILENFNFVPGGRNMANLGTNRRSTTLMNCFVHSPKDINYRDPDSIEGIYEMLKAQAHTLKSEGGYGMNFSWIRPKGTYIDGIDSRTPGMIKFMELWDKSSEIITMGSDMKVDDDKKTEKKKIRKGAMMGVLSCWHPEIEDFIKAKQVPYRLTKFNMSVGIFSDFMSRVINDQSWDLRFPDTTFEHYDDEWDGDIYGWEEKGYPIKIYKTLQARELWDLMMYSTYTRNEPGVLFFDIINKYNPLSYDEFVQTTNPCGEICMSTGVCNLGSVNLTQFVESGEFLFEKFRETVRWSIRFLDNINDISGAPLPEYKESMVTKRRIGLGTMGLGSLHFMLGIRYGSPESLYLVDKIYRMKAETEILESARLGKEKGSFKQFNKEEYFSTYWWETLPISDDIKRQVEEIGEMRNSHRSMNAPTGNTSTFANLVSGGIEPVFMKEYIRWMIVPENDRSKLKEKGLIFPDIYNGEWYETKDFEFDIRGDEQILKGTVKGIDYEIDKNRGLIKSALVEDYGWKYVKQNISFGKMNTLDESGIYATAEELTVQEHLNVLETISKYIDQNSSKTVNLPNDYSYEDFKSLYLKAWHSNIKGMTTYRTGTMAVVLEEKKKIQKYQTELDELFSKSNGDIIADIDIKLPREYNSKGYIIRDRNKKKWYLHIAFADSKYQKPFAIFVNTNNTETSEVADTFISTIESLCRDKGIREEHIESQREKYAGQTNVTKIARAIGLALRHNIAILDIVEVLGEFDLEFSSFIYHLKKFLSRFIKDGTKIVGEVCSQCNMDSIIFQEGCKSCKNCGYSVC